jgi:hypothetical protein
MPDSLPLSDLAMLDALGEASPEQRAALRVACARDPELAAEHRRLLSEVRMLDAALAPLPSPPEAAPTMPERVHRQLDAERRSTLSAFRLGRGASPANVVQIPSSPVERAALERTGAASRTTPNPALRWLRHLAIAAAVLLFAGLGAHWFLRPVTRPAAVVLSPSAETGLTKPALVWENAPGQLYNVWVLPPEGPAETVPALFVANNVTSPVPFAALKGKGSAAALEEGRDYRLLVCLAGAQRLGGVAVPFRVASNATAGLSKPPNAQAALREMRRVADEGKPGDALGLFATLSPEIQGNAEIAALEARLREQVRASRSGR